MIIEPAKRSSFKEKVIWYADYFGECKDFLDDVKNELLKDPNKTGLTAEEKRRKQVLAEKNKARRKLRAHQEIKHSRQPKKTEIKRTYTRKQLLEKFSVKSPSTLVNWEKTEDFPSHIRIGGRIYWDAKSVDEWTKHKFRKRFLKGIN